ncbi:hypothetical protein [Streptomyces sp. NPDC048612]|uniref:hypothetical protein n=1 Tax=Streptomyces sp. NPDC048612 TaxID=3365579 RepID=UPI00371FA10E
MSPLSSDLATAGHSPEPASQGAGARVLHAVCAELLGLARQRPVVIVVDQSRAAEAELAGPAFAQAALSCLSR